QVLLPTAAVGEEAQGGAGVVCAEPVPEAIDHRDRGVLRQAAQDPQLGELVEHQDQQGEPQPRQGIALGGGHQNQRLVSPGPSTTATSPLINRNRTSSTTGASHARAAVSARRVISASSAAPISPAARIGSSTRATSSRSSSRRSKSAADSGASAGNGCSPSY